MQSSENHNGSPSATSAPALTDPKLSEAIAAVWVSSIKRSDLPMDCLLSATSLDRRLGQAKLSNLAIGCVYASTSTRSSGSLTDQILKCIQAAAKRFIFVPPEFVFQDASTLRRTRRLLGLNGAISEISGGRAEVLLIDSPSRLTRNASNCRERLSRIIDSGKRVILVNDGVDSSQRMHWNLYYFAKQILSDLRSRPESR